MVRDFLHFNMLASECCALYNHCLSPDGPREVEDLGAGLAGPGAALLGLHGEVDGGVRDEGPGRAGAAKARVVQASIAVGGRRWYCGRGVAGGVGRAVGGGGRHHRVAGVGGARHHGYGWGRRGKGLEVE